MTDQLMPFWFGFLCVKKKDARLVIERYKSGFVHPDDVPFEDLSNARSGSIGSDSGSTNGGGGGGAGAGLNGGSAPPSASPASTLSGADAADGGAAPPTAGLGRENRGGTVALKSKKRLGILGIFNPGKVRHFVFVSLLLHRNSVFIWNRVRITLRF